MSTATATLGAEPARGAEDTAAAPADALYFSLPTIHCAGCIGRVERGLAALDWVADARVNLTLKRLTVRAAPERADQIVAELAALGYPAEPLDADTLAQTTQDPAGRALLMRIGVAGFAAMNVMLLSVAVWSGAEGATRTLLHLISAAIALPAALYAAQPFFANAWTALKARRLVMDTPISLAIMLALGVSLSETLMGGEHAYFDAALSLTFFLLLGRYLDHRGRAAAKSAAAELAALEVPRAERLRPDGAVETVPLVALDPGDRVLVRPGARVPTDGTILTGETEIDRGLLTGESAPVAAGPGAPVHAGETNLTGLLELRVDAVGPDTQLRQIAELVAAAEATRNRYVSLADKAARIYAPLVHLLALAAFVGWVTATGDLRLSVNIAVAVLIITCPCALGLAVPSVMISASRALFRRGVLLKDGTALERLAGVSHVVLDKTGTLTAGTPELLEPDALKPADLALAGALGRASGHPLARALAEAAEGLAPPEIGDVREVPGYGIEAVWQGRRVRLGRAAWVGAEASEDTAAWLQIEGREPVPFRFADHPRTGASAMIAGLKARGLDLRLLSGDATAPVLRLADTLGIGKAEAGLTPQDKQAEIAALRDAGGRVLMLGDGMNDAAALSAADVSISPAGGMDVARNAADMVLLNPDLSVVPQAIALAQSARRRMLENFGLAATYNAIAIPLALAGYATPLMAALAMSASSICVSLNALRVGGGRP